MKLETRHKFDSIVEMLRNKSVLVAFSGGVDSTVLASVASGGARRVLLLTVISDTLSEYEKNQASSIAEELDLDHKTITFDWLAQSDLVENTKDRCYLCKKKLTQVWIEFAEKNDLEIVVEGTTLSETEGFRPGLRALEESEVVSPFLKVGITKDEIREYAREKGLSVAENPSMACLATRFPYGTELTKDLLGIVETVEKETRRIFNTDVVRARYHRNLVRIEVGRDERSKMFDLDKLDELYRICRSLGITYVTFDVHGYQTGSMDKV